MDSENEQIRTELHDCGIDIESIWDLVNTGYRYPQAIPTLIRLLEADFRNKRHVEGIVRSLAVPEARGRAVEPLIHLFHRTPKEESSLRWAIGNSVDVTATREHFQLIAEIVSDPTNGTDRQMFVSSLQKMKSAECEQLAIRLLDDDDVVAHALSALAIMRAKIPIEKINELLNHRRPLVRRGARRALARMMEAK